MFANFIFYIIMYSTNHLLNCTYFTQKLFYRGLESMIKILVYEIDTWPSVLRRAIEYMQTASVVMPGISLLL